MIRAAIKTTAIISFFLLFALDMSAPKLSFGDTCSDGTGLPPFLGSETVTANMLIMLDNSASMHDLNYIETPSECFADNFNSGFTYAGNFLTIDETIDDTEVWYQFDAADGQFYRKPKATVATDCDATLYADGVEYSIYDGGGVLQSVCAVMAEPAAGDQEYRYFAATGKFLNWVSSSKLDVQKLVFTGGEFYEPDDGAGNDDFVTPLDGDEYLVGESRGCNGLSMIKEITVKRKDTGVDNKLTLAVRGDEEDEDGDNNYNNTLIDLYGASTGGFDNQSCQDAVTNFLKGGGPGTWKGDLADCIGFGKEGNDEHISAYNEATQECWQVFKNGLPEDGGTYAFNDIAATKNKCENFYIGGKGGPHPRTQPWGITGISGSFCSGAADEAWAIADGATDYYNFVGRCWVPPGKSITIASLDPEYNDGSSLLAGIDTDDTNGYGKTTLESTGVESQLENLDQLEMSPERRNVLLALKDFMATNGSNYFRYKVMKAVREFFVAEAGAALGDVEDTQAAASCAGWTPGEPGVSDNFSALKIKSGLSRSCTFDVTDGIASWGYYNVYVISPCSPSNTTSAQWTVNHANAPSRVYNQNQTTECGPGNWIQLVNPDIADGSFEFLNDGSGSVVIQNTQNKNTYADAVHFELVSIITTTTTSTTSTTSTSSSTSSTSSSSTTTSSSTSSTSSTSTSSTSTSTSTSSTSTTTLPAAFGYNPRAINVNPVPASVSTDGSTVTFTVTFNKDVNNFNDINDLNITTTGTVTFGGVVIAGGPRIYTVDVDILSGVGTLTLGVKTWIKNWKEASVFGGTFDKAFFLLWTNFGVVTGDYEVRIAPSHFDGYGYDSTSGLPLPDFSPFYQNPEKRATNWVVLSTALGTYFSAFNQNGWSDGGLPTAGGAPGDWRFGDVLSFTVAATSDVRDLQYNIPVTFSRQGTIIKTPHTTTTTTTSTSTTSTTTSTTTTTTSSTSSTSSTTTSTTTTTTTTTTVADCIVGTTFSGTATKGAWMCDECIEDAFLDFCKSQFNNSTIDPTNDLDTSGLGVDPDFSLIDGNFSDMVGFWTYMGLENTFGDPLETMPAKVNLSKADGSAGDEPSGLIQEYASKIRFGIQAFRENDPATAGGEASECGDHSLFQDCVVLTLNDGAEVIVPVDKGTPSHIVDLVKGINGTDAATWTPLAEAMYNAVGYFTQKGSMRLSGTTDEYPVNADDYATPTDGAWDPTGSTTYSIGDTVTYDNVIYEATSAGSSEVDAGGTIHEDEGVSWQPVNDPVIAYCQRNLLLVITEGRSTADLHPDVVTFAQANGDGDAVDVGTSQVWNPAVGWNPATDTLVTESAGCSDGLRGSTYFDDIVYYAWDQAAATSIFEYEEFSEVVGATTTKLKNKLEMHIVNTASPIIAAPADECEPDELLTFAALNTKTVNIDVNDDGVAPDPPLYYAGNPRKFYEAIRKIFDYVSTETSSGSAASVISASRSGEGALYQAIFWPDTDSGFNDASGDTIFVEWTGEVHSFLVDADGKLREDTNQNATLDAADEQVTVYYDSNAATTLACYGTIDPTTGCTGVVKQLYKVQYLWDVSDWLNDPDIDDAVNIKLNRTVFAGEQSFTADGAGVDPNPKRYIFTWNDLDNDGAVDGGEQLPFTEYLGGAGSFPSPSVASRGPVHVDFGISPDDDDKDLKVNRIINWIRGQDQGDLVFGELDATLGSESPSVALDAMRSRKMYVDMVPDVADTPDTTIYWKLGDVIHSTPITVAQPAENYDQLYRDFSYSKFSKRWLNRRHMVYFGSNDGMLHAVNGGFYDEGLKKFCRFRDYEDADNDGVLDAGEDLNGNTILDLTPACEADPDNTPVLGEEMWAYVPYNLLPHLSCLTDEDYVHKYFVDLRPRIFDVQIFTEEAACAADFEDPDCIHPGGWGTILVGGMRFGGAAVEPLDEVDAGVDWNGNLALDEDIRKFTSAYFVMDITNPEKVPTLLGEMTTTTIQEDLDDDGILDGGLGGPEDPNGNGILDGEINLGYTLAIPTMVPMKDGADTKWYLILGSGPTSQNPAQSALEGTSDQGARLAVIPLHDRMNPTSGLKSMRIPAAQPAAVAPAGTDHEEFGTIHLLNSDGSAYDDSYISDLITVDLETFSDYKADAVYFGTVTGDWTGDGGVEGWGGRLYRMVTRYDGSDAVFSNGLNQDVSKPSQWVSLLSGEPDPYNPAILYDAGQPIVTAPTVGTDGIDFWVYFGTGRFFDVADKTDSGSNATQSFYGVREPIGCGIGSPPFEGLSWRTVTGAAPPVLPGAGATRSSIGLLSVEDIGIRLDENALRATIDVVGCKKDVWVPADPGPPIVPGRWIVEADRTKIEAGVADCLGPFAAGHSLRANGSFGDLVDYIVGDEIYCSAGTSAGFDGWSRDFDITKERNLGQATLLGGLISYSTYIPNTNVCNPEGSGYLYGVYYQTGTAWFEDIFGRKPAAYDEVIEEGIYMGEGLSTTPNIHVGEEEGGKAFIQTSVGQIVEIPQPNLPSANIKSGRIKWRDIE